MGVEAGAAATVAEAAAMAAEAAGAGAEAATIGEAAAVAIEEAAGEAMVDGEGEEAAGTTGTGRIDAT